MDKWSDKPEDRTVDAITRRYGVCRKRTEALCKKHGGDDFSEPLPDDVYRRVCDDIEYLTVNNPPPKGRGLKKAFVD